MQLTKEQAVQEHRKMWNWIADQYENNTDILEQYYSIESIKEYYITQYFPKEKISKVLQGSVVRTTLHRKLSECYLRRQRADNRCCIHTPRLVFLFEITECCTKG